MKSKVLILGGVLLAVLAFPTRAALSYYYDTHVCFAPLGLISDDQRAKIAITSFRERAQSKPWVSDIDVDDCCRTVQRRAASDYGIYFRTVLFGKQAKFVEVKVDDPTVGTFYLPTNVCGQYLYDL